MSMDMDMDTTLVHGMEGFGYITILETVEGGNGLMEICVLWLKEFQVPVSCDEEAMISSS